MLRDRSPEPRQVPDWLMPQLGNSVSVAEVKIESDSENEQSGVRALVTEFNSDCLSKWMSQPKGDRQLRSARVVAQHDVEVITIADDDEDFGGIAQIDEQPTFSTDVTLIAAGTMNTQDQQSGVSSTANSNPSTSNADQPSNLSKPSTSDDGTELWDGMDVDEPEQLTSQMAGGSDDGDLFDFLNEVDDRLLNGESGSADGQSGKSGQSTGSVPDDPIFSECLDMINQPEQSQPSVRKPPTAANQSTIDNPTMKTNQPNQNNQPAIVGNQTLSKPVGDHQQPERREMTHMANLYDRANRAGQRKEVMEQLAKTYHLEPNSDHNPNDVTYCAIQIPVRVTIKHKQLPSLGQMGELMIQQLAVKICEEEQKFHLSLIDMAIQHERGVRNALAMEIKGKVSRWAQLYGKSVADKTHQAIRRTAKDKAANQNITQPGNRDPAGASNRKRRHDDEAIENGNSGDDEASQIAEPDRAPCPLAKQLKRNEREGGQAQSQQAGPSQQSANPRNERFGGRAQDTGANPAKAIAKKHKPKMSNQQQQQQQQQQPQSGGSFMAGPKIGGDKGVANGLWGNWNGQDGRGGFNKRGGGSGGGNGNRGGFRRKQPFH